MPRAHQPHVSLHLRGSPAAGQASGGSWAEGLFPGSDPEGPSPRRWFPPHPPPPAPSASLELTSLAGSFFASASGGRGGPRTPLSFSGTGALTPRTSAGSLRSRTRGRAPTNPPARRSETSLRFVAALRFSFCAVFLFISGRSPLYSSGSLLCNRSPPAFSFPPCRGGKGRSSRSHWLLFIRAWLRLRLTSVITARFSELKLTYVITSMSLKACLAHLIYIRVSFARANFVYGLHV